MPEGPEIRRAADALGRVLVGRRIEAVELKLPGLARFETEIAGSRVRVVDTRGKAMLTRFDSGLTLYSHNQLYGRWYVRRRPRLPKTSRQLRVALHTRTHSALLYSASDIEVLDEAGVARHPFLCRIGPDILAADLAPATVAARLVEPRFRRRSLAALYLDQSFLAGLGNYLRSEILWAARLHPSLRPADIDRNARLRLARNTLRIPRHSYETGGLTVPAALAARLAAEGERYGLRRFQAFGREGLACRRCGSTITRIVAGGRNLFLCPACQRA